MVEQVPNNENEPISEEAVIEAIRSDDPELPKKLDMIYDQFQQEEGPSLSGRVNCAKRVAKLQLRAGKEREAIQTLDDMLTLLEYEGTDDARKLFDELADYINGTEDSGEKKN